MSMFPTNPIGQSIAQGAANDRVVGRPHDRKQVGEEKARKRAGDLFESMTAPVDSAEAARSAKGNDQEEAHEDRQQKWTGKPGPGKPEGPSLDVRG